VLVVVAVVDGAELVTSGSSLAKFTKRELPRLSTEAVVDVVVVVVVVGVGIENGFIRVASVNGFDTSIRRKLNIFGCPERAI
jgi:hypothetical protein